MTSSLPRLHARPSRYLAVALVVLGACSSSPDAPATREAPVGSAGNAPRTATTPAPGATSSTVMPAAFASSVAPITPDVAQRMSASWRPGCPVPLDQLRLVTVSYWGFDRQPHRGELVLHADHADDAVEVFRALFEASFPIEQIRLVDEFGGDDDRSMASNNTSAFNCRAATGSSRWSEHAYGRAIDINPVQNPYVGRTGAVAPPEGAEHVDRDAQTPGLITPGGPVVAAFDAIGWGWGGRWEGVRDYQHFSATGR